MSLILSVSFVPLAGCKSKTEDALARAMQRRRSSSDDEDDGPKKKPQPSAQPDMTVATPSSQAMPESNAVVSSTEGLGIKPIEDRNASVKGDSARRRASASNLVAIHKAIMAYEKRKGTFPLQKTKTPDGFDGLSWRVEILPDLGYPELYAKFDKSQPWNREPNLSLLRFIPDEYVSPERRDVKTNYLVPVKNNFVFGGIRKRTVKDIEDGLNNTIFLLEMNDSLAVEWTKPVDYEPKLVAGDVSNIDDALGGLRGEGTFAIWGNGYPTMLVNSLPPKLFYKSWTIDGGDSALPGLMHREIPFEASFEASLTSVEVAKEDEKPTASHSEVAMAIELEVPTDRLDVPPAVEIMVADRKLRAIFEEEVSGIERPEQLARVASKLMATAEDLKTDPPGMYATLRWAEELAAQSQSFTTTLKAIDSQVVSFEVDAYETNLNGLASFAKKAGKHKMKSGDSLRYLQRAIRTVMAGVRVDDYASAIEQSRMAARIVDAPRGGTLQTLLSQLTTSLGNAKASYDRVKDGLAAYRRNPEDGEAASVVGRYLCFVKGDWDQGLSLLIKGGPEVLQEIAARDIQGASDAAEMIVLGDQWWALAERAKVPVYRSGSLDRAMIWYQDAYQTLPQSLDKMHVKARIEDGADQASSPMALLKRLAEETNVNLSVPLAAVHVKAAGASDDD